MSLHVYVCVGIPASGKSTWAQQQIANDPYNWVRINNDCLRDMAYNYVFSKENEKLITKTRQFMIEKALKLNKNVILDNTNTSIKDFNAICDIVEKADVDAIVEQKLFYIDLEEAINRDAKRTGSSHIGESVVRKFWKKLGGTKFQSQQPLIKSFAKKAPPIPYVQDANLPACAIFDLDGTMCEISHRNPYDASNCHLDGVNAHVVDLAKLLHNNGYQIFFFSGREDKYQASTEAWLRQNFGYPYFLHMRETNNTENDSLLKERLFVTHIKDKYNCKLWVDDRLRVCQYVHRAGLPLFRVGDPNANF